MTPAAQDKAKLATTAASLLVFFWLAASSSMQNRVLGVVFLALVLWSLYPKRHFATSVAIVALLAFFEASLSLEEFIESLFSTYGGSGLWIIVSGFLLSSAMESSGLAKRIALWIVTGLGGDPGKVVLSIALANLAVAPLSPSTTAKAFMLLPICVSLVEAFSSDKSSRRYGAAVMMMSMTANNICSTGFLTATVPNSISTEYLRNSTSLDLGWFEWLVMALPVTLVLLASAWLLCRRMFNQEPTHSGSILEQVTSLRRQLGPVNRGEALVAVVFAASLVLWITEDLFGFNGGLVSLGLCLVLFIPGTKAIEVKGFARRIPWGSMALFAASLFLARAVGRWDALDPVAQAAFDLLGLSRVRSAYFVPLLVVVALFLHVGFTSTTVYATVMIPIVVSFAELQGVRPELVALPVAFLTPLAMILPVNTIPNIVFFSTGYFTQQEMAKYGVLVTLISAILILGVRMPYWRMLGLIQF